MHPKYSPMIIRLLNALAWASLIFSFLVFIICYANFPDEVLVYIKTSGEPVLFLGKDVVFYSILAITVIFNLGWLVLSGIVKRTTPNLESTIGGLSVTQIGFNLFFATSVYFINILNSRENFDYSNFGLLIYITGGFLIGAILYTAVARFILKK